MFSLISGDLRQSSGISVGLLEIAISLAWLYLFVVDLSVSVRRLHDINRSGWWTLLYLTVIGTIPLLIMMCFDTNPRINKWGYPAK